MPYGRFVVFASILLSVLGINLKSQIGATRDPRRIFVGSGKQIGIIDIESILTPDNVDAVHAIMSVNLGVSTDVESISETKWPILFSHFTGATRIEDAKFDETGCVYGLVIIVLKDRSVHHISWGANQYWGTFQFAIDGIPFAKEHSVEPSLHPSVLEAFRIVSECDLKYHK